LKFAGGGGIFADSKLSAYQDRSGIFFGWFFQASLTGELDATPLSFRLLARQEASLNSYISRIC
jgi:hypothetical protein